MPLDRRLVAAGLASALLLGACSVAASPAPTASPTGGPGPITHPLDPAALVLRFDESGGLVMPTFSMVRLPYFSLYGDGAVLYRPVSASWPEQPPGEPTRVPPLRVATMTEDQVQALLQDALGAGGLAVARDHYDNSQVADGQTAVFTVNADGRQRRVSVYALEVARDGAGSPNPDAAVLGAMAALAERLRNFDQDVAKGNAAAAGVYAPTRFRASILEGGLGGDGPTRPWPWPAFGPDGFTALPDGNGPGFPSRTISGAELSLLGVTSAEGGLSGISLVAPNGTVYSLAIRPLLPDELR